MTGRSRIGQTLGAESGTRFRAWDPARGVAIEPAFVSATDSEVERAAALAEAAAAEYRAASGAARGAFLRACAERLEARGDALVARAGQETALPEPRLRGELRRTANQLRLFAALAEEGSWVDARIDRSHPAQENQPRRPDLRSCLRPLGPVAVFGASNFPLAFSVAGGDTASALAAGCPVIVKAHPAHPGTSELAANVIRDCVAAAGLHEGVFSLLFDSGIEVGTRLVQHPLIKAVGFTGSLQAGRALMDLCASRPEPIPCYAEMSSTNPVFVLPGALKEHDKIAADLTASYTLGAGQFCTKPGLVFLPPQDETSGLVEEMRRRAASLPAFTMLTAGIAAQYKRGIAQQTQANGARVVAAPDTNFGTAAALLEADAEDILKNPALTEEIFGPTTLLVRYQSREQMLRIAESLQGHLTATLLGTEEDLAGHQDLIAILERKVGRIIFNGYPTGVEVCHSMVHGGPYPATSESKSTSVGTLAVYRFARPVCYQNIPQPVLPEALRDSNQLGLLRMVNGQISRDAI